MKNNYRFALLGFLFVGLQANASLPANCNMGSSISDAVPLQQVGCYVELPPDTTLNTASSFVVRYWSGSAWAGGQTFNITAPTTAGDVKDAVRAVIRMAIASDTKIRFLVDENGVVTSVEMLPRESGYMIGNIPKKSITTLPLAP
jgi:hypothetical protein